MADDAHPGRGLLERSEELARIAAVLAGAAAGRGGVLAVEGPAGIGKTGILDAAEDRKIRVPP